MLYKYIYIYINIYIYIYLYIYIKDTHYIRTCVCIYNKREDKCTPICVPTLV